MSKRGDLARPQSILAIIGDLGMIVERHGMIIVHDYDRVNLKILGEIIDRDIPELALAIRRVLEM